MFHRVADFIALADANYGADSEAVKATADKFYHMISSLNFIEFGSVDGGTHGQTSPDSVVANNPEDLRRLPDYRDFCMESGSRRLKKFINLPIQRAFKRLRRAKANPNDIK